VRTTRRLDAALAIAATALTLAACGGNAGNASLPACSTGHGNGETATLAIHQDGDHFTGTYLTAIGGGTNLRYDVQGTARDGHLTSTWSVGFHRVPRHRDLHGGDHHPGQPRRQVLYHPVHQDHGVPVMRIGAAGATSPTAAECVVNQGPVPSGRQYTTEPTRYPI
jgi:hypothetical protein